MVATTAPLVSSRSMRAMPSMAGSWARLSLNTGLGWIMKVLRWVWNAKTDGAVMATVRSCVCVGRLDWTRTNDPHHVKVVL
jgi:hypothetical protein